MAKVKEVFGVSVLINGIEYVGNVKEAYIENAPKPKVYFVSYVEVSLKGLRTFFNNKVMAIHPLKWQSDNQTGFREIDGNKLVYKIVLLHWIELTPEEAEIHMKS